MAVLVTTIRQHIARIEAGDNQDLIEIHHLFYDKN